MNVLHRTALLASFLLGACSGLRQEPVTDDALMAHLTESQREQIDAARAEHDHRSDDLAQARQDVERAKAQQQLAKTDLSVAEARVDAAESAVAVAATGTTDEMTEAREALVVAEAKVVPHRDLIHWRECDVTRAEKAALLAEREEELALARVGLEKARAFSKSDRASAADVDVPKHEARVRECQRLSALARVELDAAARECNVAEKSYDAAQVVSTKD
ncbi:MAG: DUF4398 domain-containing protein [Planctomycetes bacterium]|jgi:hypothetical protein|nr:DUF4398 domain-containing protein [Planctomycetota bacterium]